jgi:hypothetical protein
MWCGQAPSTAENLIIASKEDVVIPDSISSDDMEIVQLISDQCKQLVSFELEMRDEKARGNNMRRDIKEGVAPQVTRFDLIVGEQVSYDGKKVRIVELTGQGGVSQTAKVDIGDGKMKQVQYRDLRPLAVGRPCRELQNMVVSVGDFVMWKSSDNQWVGGKVVEGAAERGLTVHRMQGSSSGVAWLYLWTCGKDIYRQEEKPDGADAMREEVSISEIRVCGALKPTNRVTEALRKRMEDLEII